MIKTGEIFFENIIYCLLYSLKSANDLLIIFLQFYLFNFDIFKRNIAELSLIEVH